MAGAFGHEDGRLSALLDDELDEQAALEVTRHLRGCEACSEELEELRATRSALRSLPPAQPSLSWMVETAVLGPGDGRPNAVGPIALALLAATLVVLGGAFVLGGEDGSVQPPVDRMVVDHVRSVEGGPVVTPVRLEAGAGEGG